MPRLTLRNSMRGCGHRMRPRWICGITTPKPTTSIRSTRTSSPALLVCSPQYLHSASACGVWSLPDRSTPYKKAMEDDLDAALAMYLKEVEQRHWYGFWDFGDVMHAYDPGRHVWRYDIGGFA